MRVKETYRCEWVKCNKKGCASCPHGPYWYAYHKAAGKLHKRYCGKGDPRAARPAAAPPPHTWDAVFNDRKISAAVCWQVLGLAPTQSFEDLRSHYRKVSLANHPDRGGDELAFKRIAAAYSYLSKMLQGR
jgi:hypothetical protein